MNIYFLNVWYQTLLNILALKFFDFECTYRRLFQNCAVRTKFNIYVFIMTYDILQNCVSFEVFLLIVTCMSLFNLNYWLKKILRNLRMKNWGRLTLTSLPSINISCVSSPILIRCQLSITPHTNLITPWCTASVITVINFGTYYNKKNTTFAGPD